MRNRVVSNLRNRMAKLEKLESIAQETSGPTVSVTDVYKAALAILSAADRALVIEANTGGSIVSLADSNPVVWERFDAALGEATTQTGFPIRFLALDWEFIC
jgi:hypothetical protein